MSLLSASIIRLPQRHGLGRAAGAGREGAMLQQSLQQRVSLAIKQPRRVGMRRRSFDDGKLPLLRRLAALRASIRKPGGKAGVCHYLDYLYTL